MIVLPIMGLSLPGRLRALGNRKIQNRRSRKQNPRVFMLGMIEHIVAQTLFDDIAGEAA